MVFGVVVVLFGTFLRSFLLSGFLREDIGALVTSQQLALANYVAHDIDGKLVARQQMLHRLAGDLPLELLDRPVRLSAWLEHHHRLQPLFSHGLRVLDPQGTVLAAWPASAGRASTSYAGNADFKALRAGASGKARVGAPAIDAAMKEAVLPISFAVTDAAGQVRAVLVGITALASPGFLDLLQTSEIGESGSFLLISPRDKLFVGATDPAMALTPTPAPGVNSLHDRAMDGFRGTGTTINSRGVEEISAVTSVPSADWFVVARLPTAEAFATITRMQSFILRNSIVILFALSLSLAGLVLWRVFRPLFSSARLADAMSRGELPLQPLPVVRDDEVGHLTTAFNRLLARLVDSQAELTHLARHDMLTGLPNRLLLADRLQQALLRAQRNRSQLAVLFLDLDGFKPINDRLGHDAGDDALREVATRLGEAVRHSDTLARVGGDEFVVVLTDLDQAGAAEAVQTVAEKCIAAMAAPFILGGQSCTMGVSIGAVVGDGESSADSLLLVADNAMYRAKESGRGCWVMSESC